MTVRFRFSADVCSEKLSLVVNLLFIAKQPQVLIEASYIFIAYLNENVTLLVFN